MMALKMTAEEKAVANLLWEVKAIATKEFESLPTDYRQNIFTDDVDSVASEECSEDCYVLSDRRHRTVSIESMDMVTSTSVSSPKLTSKTITIIDARFTDSPCSDMDHDDWSKRVSSTLLADDASLVSPSLISSPTVVITQKYGKRKRENYVGLSAKKGSVRATLRKKFSWKQFPEVSLWYYYYFGVLMTGWSERYLDITI